MKSSVLENKAMINKNFRGMKEYGKSYFKRNELGQPSIKNRNRKGSKTATASTIVSYGDTVVMANVVAAKTAKPDIDFFPLTVSYQEKILCCR